MTREPGPARGGPGKKDGRLPGSTLVGIDADIHEGINRNAGRERLLGTPVPNLPREQLALFRPENLQLRPAGTFNPAEVLDLLRRSRGVQMGYADYGGDKAAAGILEVGEDGKFKVIKNIPPRVKTEKERGGTGYVDYSENAASEFRRQGVSIVGTSFAGPIDGTRPIVATNIPVLQSELDARHEGDLAHIFQYLEGSAINGTNVTVAGGNDGIAALVSSIIEAYRINPKVKKVYSLIFGGGNGGSIWEISESGKEVLMLASEPASVTAGTGEMIAAEPGHVPVIDEMNPFGRVEICGQPTSPYKDVTCVEKIAGSGEGITKTFLEQTGRELKGIQISEIHQGEGPEAALATSIYDAAARMVATEAVGMDRALNIRNGQEGRVPLDSDTVVVIHGGLTKTPGIPERIVHILEAHLLEQGYEHKPTLLFTKDFSENACADGAAILALMANAS